VKEIQIRVGPGTLRYIYDDSLISLKKLGITEIRRASHVEPTNDAWIADLSPVGGPVLGPFQLREEALQAEVTWLYQHKIPTPKEH